MNDGDHLRWKLLLKITPSCFGVCVLDLANNLLCKTMLAVVSSAVVREGQPWVLVLSGARNSVYYCLLSLRYYWNSSCCFFLWYWNFVISLPWQWNSGQALDRKNKLKLTSMAAYERSAQMIIPYTKM
jgi:hypothetical protein